MTQEQLNKQLFEAVRKDDIEAIKKAINDGADIEYTDKNGWKPLHSTAVVGRIKIAKVLIENGANVNARDESSRTCIHYAVREEHTELGNMLIDNGGRL